MPPVYSHCLPILEFSFKVHVKAILFFLFWMDCCPNWRDSLSIFVLVTIGLIKVKENSHFFLELSPKQQVRENPLIWKPLKATTFKEWKSLWWNVFSFPGGVFMTESSRKSQQLDTGSRTLHDMRFYPFPNLS